jgi:hypothetical protein
MLNRIINEFVFHDILLHLEVIDSFIDPCCLAHLLSLIASPDFRLRAVLSYTSVIACLTFGLLLTFSEAENVFALAAIERSLAIRERKRKAS